MSEGINEVDCIENFWCWKMIAYETKINIFEEMRYFLMFYLNSGFIVCSAVVLLILSNFSFLSIGHSFSRTFILFFWQEYMSTLFELNQDCTLWSPNLGKTLENILILQICWFLIHMQSLNFLCNQLRWSPPDVEVLQNTTKSYHHTCHRKSIEVI